MSDKAALAFAVSKGCLEPVQILLKSIEHNNRAMQFEVFFLYMDMDDEERLLYQSAIESCGYDCHFIKANIDYLPESEYKHITKETFLRLFLPELLPNRLKKVLYLDIDIIVNGSLEYLYKMPFSGYSIIAAEVSKDPKDCLTEKRAMAIPRSAIYFNAGVLMMNLSKLRKDEHFKKEYIVDFLQNRMRNIRENDQGYLNFFLWDKVKIVNCYVYNYDAGIYFCHEKSFFERLKYMFRMLQREKFANDRSVIIHYRGPNKPWKDNYDGQCYSIYMYYARMAGYVNNWKQKYKHYLLKKVKVLQLIVKGN